MASQSEVYLCERCGILTEVLHAGQGALSCCGAPMKAMIEGTTDAAKEKHVPTVEKTADGIRVTVGSVEHPMAPEHWIQWIEVQAGDRTMHAFLKPGDKPTAEFCIRDEPVVVRAYCNLHGHWKA